jgi:hypothetical protein
MFNEGACAGGCGEVRDVGDFLYHDGEAYCEKCLPATILSEAGIECPELETYLLSSRQSRDDVRPTLIAVCEGWAAAEAERKAASFMSKGWQDKFRHANAKRREAEAQLATVTEEKDRVRRVADTETKAKFLCWDFIRDHGLGQEFYEATHFSFAKGSSRVQKEAGDE